MSIIVNIDGAVSPGRKTNLDKQVVFVRIGYVQGPTRTARCIVAFRVRVLLLIRNSQLTAEFALPSAIVGKTLHIAYSLRMRKMLSSSSLGKCCI